MHPRPPKGGRGFPMPKVSGPCLNVSARGTLARILSFVKTARGHVCRKTPRPPDAETPNQLYRRRMFAFLQQNWSDLEPADRATWQTPADVLRISPINAYLRENLLRWDNYFPPAAYLPIAQTGAVGTFAVFRLTTLAILIQVEYRLAAVNQNWGVFFFVNQGSAPAYTPDYLYHIQLQNHNLFTTHTFTPTAPGTYYFRAALFSHNGEQVNMPQTRNKTWPP